MKMMPRTPQREGAQQPSAKRWARSVKAVLACAVAAALASVGVVYAEELAPQEPSYDWYTDDPDATEFTVSNGSDLRGLANLVNGTADLDGDGAPEPAVDFRGKVISQSSRRGGMPISLAGQEFTPIGTPEHPFQGTFEGGRTPDAEGDLRNSPGNDDIRELKITKGSAYVGLFGYCGEYSMLRGIYVSDAALTGFEPSYISLPTPATPASFSPQEASLEGSTLLQAQNATDSAVIHDVGSICGYTEGSVEYCESRATVVAENALQATNDVPAVVLNVGGIAGTVEGKLTSCSYTGNLTVTAPSLASDASDAVAANVGGVAGTLGVASDDGRSSRSGAATNCTNGLSDESGLFGIGKTQTAIHVVTTGVGGLDRFGVQKEATSSAVGGIVGYSYGPVVGCSNYGMVNTNSVAATLYKDGSASQNVHLVEPANLKPATYPMAEKLFKIANGGSGVGGIVGSMRASGLGVGAVSRTSNGSADNQITLSNCFNTGMVVGLARTGGIAGAVGTYSPVDACRNGKVSAASGTGVQDDSGHVVTTRWNKPMTGGIAGTVESSISNCANLSEVENIQTGYYTAGIVGGLDSPAAYTSECFACFNTGQVHVASYATQAYREAGLVGNNGGYLHDCVMRSGCVLSHDDGDAAYPNAAIGDDSWGMWSNVKFASAAELKKSEPAAVLNASHAADVLTLPEEEWVYWYVKGGYPTLSLWDPPTDRAQLTADNVSASCAELAEYAGNMEAIPMLVVMYGTGKQEKLVQNVDYYVLPQTGATAMTGDAIDMYPYNASIVGIGNYQGRVLDVCKYGIGPCDLKNCEVSTTSAKYNFETPVYPEAVYVRNPAGALLDPSEFRYEIYGGTTYTLTSSNVGNYVVFDSEGFVSWDDGATKEPVSGAAAHERLCGDLTGVDYVLYNADGARIYEVSDSGATKLSFDPVSGNEVDSPGPTLYKPAREGVKGGGLAGYIVKVSAAEGAKAVKKSSWTSGQYVIEAIDLFRDATIEKVTLDVPNDDGSATQTRTWLWNSEKSTLYEAVTAPDGGLSLKLDDGGEPIPAKVKFTGSQLKPKAVVTFAKEDGTSVEIVEDRAEGYTLVYGDPYTAKADLTYFNRDATPLTEEDATPPADATDEQKKELVELAKQLKGNEKAAVTVRSVLGLRLTNYVHMYFPITPAALAECTVDIGGTDLTADVRSGQAAVAEEHDAAKLPDFAYRQGYGVRPSVTLRRCGNELIEGVDYEVSYANNVKATDDDAIKAYADTGDASGLASFTVKGLGNVTGSYTGYFIVATGKNLTAQGYEIEPIADQPDNLGRPVRPVGGVHLAKREDSGELVRDESMVEGRDFSVGYAEGGELSSATVGNHGAKVTVQGINKYTGTLSASFETFPLDLSAEENAWRLGPWESGYANEDGSVPSIWAYTSYNRRIYPIVDWAAYDPQAKGGIDESVYGWSAFPYRFQNKQTGQVYTNERYYEAGTSLELPPPGDYVATVDYAKQGSYQLAGQTEIDVTLVKYDLANYLSAGFSPFRYDAQTYDGQPKEPVSGVHDNWSIEYSDNVEAGTAYFTVTAPEDDVYYEGSYAGSFQINAFDVSDADVHVADQLYTGKALEPEVRVTSGDWTLVEGVDYTVTYANNMRKGTATAIVRGIGSCEGRVDAEFAIGDRLNIADALVDPVLDQLYTGQEIKPELRLWLDDQLLVEGQDYDVEYSNNRALSVEGSPARAKVVGKGQFARSSTEVEFRIVSACDIAQATCLIPDQAYTGVAIEPAVSVYYGSKELVQGTDYELAYRRNVKAGADARAVIKGKGNYTGRLDVPFNIVVRASSGDGGVQAGAGAIARFGTEAQTPEAFALAVAEETCPGPVECVVVAWAHDPRSQLLAQVLGAAQGWPLLVCGHDAVDAATRAYIAEHGVQKALIVGDQNTVGERCAVLLQDLGLQVERLAQPDDVYRSEAWPHASIAALANPYDLEAASGLAAWAAARGLALYLTEPDGTLGQQTAADLAGCSELVVAGGPTKVDARSLEGLPDTLKVVRLAGAAGAAGLGDAAAVSAYAVENGVAADGAVVVNAASLTSQMASVQLAADRGVALVAVNEGTCAGAAPLASCKAPAYGVTAVGGEARFPDELCDSVAKELGWK